MVMNILKHIFPAKYLLPASALLVASVSSVRAQELRAEVFDLLDLDRPGLEKVKADHGKGDDAAAACDLLEYYRARQDIRTPEIRDVSKVRINKEQQQWADDALNHTFFVHYGYQPSFNYGEDIDWKYWPVQDNELRWQLHRHKWFTPMGYAYRVSGDEKYAKEWVLEYMDWIRKNPQSDKENARFAWRPLEVSHRIQDQCLQFQLFVDSPYFTPEFLTEFLVNYHRHAVHIMGNWSKQGNHLLFEAQRMLYAGSFFPEFKEAAEWRQSGVDILNREVKVQVLPDGGHFELDPHYHLATIEIFLKSLRVADLNGFRNDFPQSYQDAVESMIMWYVNTMYPDCTNPCFSDAKITGKKEMLKHFRQWAEVFPENAAIRWYATEGAEGAQPDYLSKGFNDSGFYVFRNGWGMDALQMDVKAGPAGEWHAQPDFGTFELWYNGKCLFQDSGSYVYEGKDPEIMAWRNWFRATCHHNTLTMDGKDVDKVASETLLWQPDGDVQILVTEHPSYPGLIHRRSIFFVGGEYFVIVDEASGQRKGWVNLNWQMPRGKIPNSREDMTFYSEFEDDSNFMFRCFGPDGMSMKKEEGWQSPSYMKKVKRMCVSFNAKKAGNEPVRFITVIHPKQEAGYENISAKFTDRGFSNSGLSLEVKVGKGKKVKLGYKLQ